MNPVTSDITSDPPTDTVPIARALITSLLPTDFHSPSYNNDVFMKPRTQLYYPEKNKGFIVTHLFVYS